MKIAINIFVSLIFSTFLHLYYILLSKNISNYLLRDVNLEDISQIIFMIFLVAGTFYLILSLPSYKGKFAFLFLLLFYIWGFSGINYIYPEQISLNKVFIDLFLGFISSLIIFSPLGFAIGFLIDKTDFNSSANSFRLTRSNTKK